MSQPLASAGLRRTAVFGEQPRERQLSRRWGHVCVSRACGVRRFTVCSWRGVCGALGRCNRTARVCCLSLELSPFGVARVLRFSDLVWACGMRCF